MAVINASMSRRWFTALAALLSLLAAGAASVTQAGVLPEDRADLLYHRYEGDGLTIDGPSVLVRKQFKDKVSVWGNYYIDNISGASIDLLTQGSTFYQENRTETSLGVDYLHDKTIFSISATNSSERDYEANTIGFAVSQDFFGDMSTLTLSYSQGNDEVRENIYENNVIIDTEDRGEVKRQRFGIALTQILTPRLLLTLNSETVVDEGFLNNPYRSVRFLSGADQGFQREVYPGTRTSDAFSVKAIYYLPYRASLRGEYRTYSDSWGIDAQNFELRYLHPINERLVIEAKYRNYDQSQASFFSDLFPFQDAQNFLARDKELSDNSNFSVGLGLTYDLKQNYIPFFETTTLNFFWDHTAFDFNNFREVTGETTAEFGIGNEPFFSFNANIIRLFISVTY